jgi:hypothetical protein
MRRESMWWKDESVHIYKWNCLKFYLIDTMCLWAERKLCWMKCVLDRRAVYVPSYRARAPFNFSTMTFIVWYILKLWAYYLTITDIGLRLYHIVSLLHCLSSLGLARTKGLIDV